MSRTDTQDWSARHLLEARTAATIRAMADRPGIHFEAGMPWDGEAPLANQAPHLVRQPGLDDAMAYRALADALALRLLDSDERLHQAGLPVDQPVAALLYEWMEQWRVESLVPAHWPGVRSNLLRRFARWVMLFEGSGLLETRSGQHLFCFALMAHSRIMGEPIDARLEDVIESAHYRMGAILAPALGRMARLRQDQAAFGEQALALALRMDAWFTDLIDTSAKTQPRRHLNFSIPLLAPSESEEEHGHSESAGHSGVSQQVRGYAVWTRRFDTEIAADQLMRAAVLHDYRGLLDAHFARHPMPITKLAQVLQRALSTPQTEGREFSQETGLIDGRRLAQLISSPHNHRIFFREQPVDEIRARLTLLVDCSGSMRHHRLQLAVMMDVLSRALGRAGIPHEILGFTTGAWQGGRAAKDWVSHGRRPEHPGRLNELQHIIFRSETQSRQQRRLSLAAVMRPEIFREGIDGEAVQWACQRLLSQSSNEHERKILWVLSDGGPMDGATALANPPGFLDTHLRQTVHEQMQENHIEILGIGVGHDLSAFYPRSIALDFEGGLTQAALLNLARTLYQR